MIIFSEELVEGANGGNLKGLLLGALIGSVVRIVLVFNKKFCTRLMGCESDWNNTCGFGWSIIR